MRLLALVVVLSVGCIHRVGEACNTGDAFCLDPKTGATCEAGALVKADCPGPKGCVVTSKRQVMCDETK